MKDMFDRLLSLSLGAFSLTKEKAEKYFDEMVERGEINREDAKKSVDEVIKKGEEQKENLRKMIQEELDSKTAVSRAEYDELLERVKNLESKLPQ